MTDFLTPTKTAYDTIVDGYAEHASDEYARLPLERNLLATFAELVGPDAGPVADVGCGHGYLTARLNDLGLNAFGIDLSPNMLARARADYPKLRFEEGSMTALDVGDGELAGLVASYSTIHIPEPRLPQVFAGFHRALAPGGQLMLAFLIGDGHVLRTEAYGHTIALDYWLRQPEPVAELLTQAGFHVHARVRREPTLTEQIPRAYLLASKNA